MVEIKFLSDEGMCLNQKDLPRLKGGTYYIIRHDTLGTLGTELFVLVNVAGKGQYLADKQSGSLYNPKTLRGYAGPIGLYPVCKSK